MSSSIRSSGSLQSPTTGDNANLGSPYAQDWLQADNAFNSANGFIMPQPMDSLQMSAPQHMDPSQQMDVAQQMDPSQQMHMSQHMDSSQQMGGTSWGSLNQEFQNPFSMSYGLAAHGESFDTLSHPTERLIHSLAGGSIDSFRRHPSGEYGEPMSPLSAPQPRRFTVGLLRQQQQRKSLPSHLDVFNSLRFTITITITSMSSQRVWTEEWASMMPPRSYERCQDRTRHRPSCKARARWALASSTHQPSSQNLI